jgi:predicted ATPase/class 3 adenylate cyclase
MNSNPGIATFLFTDLESSTPLWENHPELMPELSARHDAIMREAIEVHRGQVVKTTGDGFHAVFESASDGIAAALAGQQAIIAESWPADTGPLRVRMGLHTGESRQREGDYYGAHVNRAARVMGLAYGGQVLISGATAGLVRTALPPQVSLSDLGEHRLRGLTVADRVFQVGHPALQNDFPPLKSLSVTKHNLPLQLTTFVGREKELAEVKRLLEQTQLLTLLGPGGTGKTRLMMEVAEDAIGEFEDGVWMVELAPLTDPGLIPERIAAVLTVQEQPGRAMPDALVDYLRRKELLLLLDNVEHLVHEAAELAEHLLIQCPKLKILVTGREALFIGGEITLQVPSLSLPSGNGSKALEEIGSSEGVQLFVTRVQDIHPGFELSRANADTIAEIVRRLDGIPFALELAASRTRMLSVDQIAERLNDRFRLLTGGRRTALPRQQTLQAMIDWSWNLLDEEERMLLQRLSVFSRGWTIEAAQQVAGADPLDEYDVFELLEQLVNKSLVTVKYPVEGEARYGMLESIRQYGRDRLFEAGEGVVLRDRHADYFAAFAEEAGPHLAQSTMLAWLERVTLELDNLGAALTWTVEDRPELALRIGGNLLKHEVQLLTPREAQNWLQPAIDKTRGLLDRGETKIRTADFLKALLGLILTYLWQGRSDIRRSLTQEAIQLARATGESLYLVQAISLKYAQDFFDITPQEVQEIEEAITISRENGFERERALLFGTYAYALYLQGKGELALHYFQEAITIVRKIDNPGLNVAIYSIKSTVAQMQGDLKEAKQFMRQAIMNYEALNHRGGVLSNQSELAHILRREGDIAEAEALYRQSIVGWQEMGQRPAVAHQLECFAIIAISRGNYEHAAKLLGAARSIREQLNATSNDPREIAELALALDQLNEGMGEEERDRAMEEGRLMNLDEAVQVALIELS